MTVHKLRHTFISTLYNETNVDIVQLQELAGHSNIVTTKRYIHTKKEKLFEAVNNNPLNDLDL
jgi:site-specific recombinase XerD